MAKFAELLDVTIENVQAALSAGWVTDQTLSP